MAEIFRDANVGRPGCGNRPHTRPEFDQIRFNCTADQSPNVLEMHARDCARVRLRAHMRGSESRVTRYDVVSRDNAGMPGDKGTCARQNGLRGANTFRTTRSNRRTHVYAGVRTHLQGKIPPPHPPSSLSLSLRLHPGTHYLWSALITLPPPPALARLIRVLPDKSSPKNRYIDRSGPSAQTIRRPRSVINHVNPSFGGSNECNETSLDYHNWKRAFT